MTPLDWLIVLALVVYHFVRHMIHRNSKGH